MVTLSFQSQNQKQTKTPEKWRELKHEEFWSQISKYEEPKTLSGLWREELISMDEVLEFEIENSYLKYEFFGENYCSKFNCGVSFLA